MKLEVFGSKILLFTLDNYFIDRGDHMKPNYENKIKDTQCKKNKNMNCYNNIMSKFTCHFKESTYERRQMPNRQNKLTRTKHHKRDKLIKIYRICQGKKSRILKEDKYYPDAALELIDKFRNILNAMLEDEEGIYPKDEILDVSRELDDIIYYYYKNISINGHSLEEAIDN